MKIMKNKILYMAALALAFTACSEEDIMQPANGQSGSLHISSVIIDGQQVARSRVVAENDGTYNINELPVNHSITGFSVGDEMELYYSFEPVSWEDADECAAKARFGGSSWTLSGTEIMPATEESTFIIKPGNGEKWEHVKMYASVAPGGEECSIATQEKSGNTTPQYVLGDINDDDVWQVTDCLYASTEDGSITVDTDLKSPTLGAVTIRFKHQDALLRLPITEDALNVATGNYIVNGEAYHVTGLATLWAVLDENESYVPFTQVGNNLQAIVDKTEDFNQLLTGFKAVLYTTASGKPGDGNYNESEVLTLDLPFKVGGSASTGIVLEENTQYPLTLNISPVSAEVNFTIPNGKPGWGTTEEELSNAENECDLSYITASNTFLVGSAEGLRNLNMWMMGKTTTENFKEQVNFVPASSKSNFNINGGTSSAYEKNIKLMADITLPNTDINGNAIAITDGVPSGSNWIAIGTYTNQYTGTIDGNGKTLGGMVINATENCQGFVGYLGTNGKIKNLTFANAQVVTSEVNAGIVAGYNYGIVENCHTIGDSSVKGDSYVGGIVGYNLDGTITNCTNAAQVVATNQITSSSVGGITGENQNVVSFCINSGSVSGSEGVGGIVGYQQYAGKGVIACGNTGSVSGSIRVGGIVGWNSESNAIASWTITTAEMDQSGATPVKKDGVGQNYNGNIPACYSVADAADLDSEVSIMNIVLLEYYDTNDTKYYWTPGTNGGWPTLTTEKPTIMPG